MTVAKFLQPNNATQSGSAYKNSIDASIAVLARMAASFAPHENDTGSPATPDMTVRLDAGVLWDASGPTLTEVAAQSTGTIAAPSANPRIDRIVVDAATGAVSVITGAEAASPTAPAIAEGKIPVCQVLLDDSPPTTEITDALITDERPGFFGNSGGAAGDGQYQSIKVFGYPTAYSDTFTTNFAGDANQLTIASAPTQPFVVDKTAWRLTTTGTLPAPLAVDTDYFIVTINSTSTIELSATAGGTPIALTDDGAGTHTIAPLAMWTKPSGLMRAEVIATAGGGGGADSDNSATKGRAGGGGGGSAIELIEDVALGATETVTVGAGGLGGTATGASGAAGGTTSFGAHCSATGGAGGTNTTGGVGGGAVGGSLNLAGAGGNSTNNTSPQGGAGGGSYWGGGAAGRYGNAAGTDGRVGGGGGGGSTSSGSSYNGGNGGGGVVVIREYF